MARACMLPIQHLAVVGGYRWKSDNKDWYCSDAVTKAMRVVPVIISIAAPTLLTLTIFGMKGDHRFLLQEDLFRSHRMSGKTTLKNQYSPSCTIL